jgi:hypothetical protein
MIDLAAKERKEFKKEAPDSLLFFSTSLCFLPSFVA